MLGVGWFKVLFQQAANGRSLFEEAFGVNVPILEWPDVKMRMLELWSSQRPDRLAMVSTRDNFDRLAATVSYVKAATATSRRKKSGGRKRLAADKRRCRVIGLEVDRNLPRLEPGFRLLRKLKIDRFWTPEALRNELLRHQFRPEECDALLCARTAMGAAKRFVAEKLSRPGQPLSLQTVRSYYSRHLALKS